MKKALIIICIGIAVMLSPIKIFAKTIPATDYFPTFNATYNYNLVIRENSTTYRLFSSDYPFKINTSNNYLCNKGMCNQYVYTVGNLSGFQNGYFSSSPIENYGLVQPLSVSQIVYSDHAIYSTTDTTVMYDNRYVKITSPSNNLNVVGYSVTYNIEYFIEETNIDNISMQFKNASDIYYDDNTDIENFEIYNNIINSSGKGTMTIKIKYKTYGSKSLRIYASKTNDIDNTVVCNNTINISATGGTVTENTDLLILKPLYNSNLPQKFEIAIKYKIRKFVLQSKPTEKNIIFSNGDTKADFYNKQRTNKTWQIIDEGLKGSFYIVTESYILTTNSIGIQNIQVHFESDTGIPPYISSALWKVNIYNGFVDDNKDSFDDRTSLPNNQDDISYIPQPGSGVDPNITSSVSYLQSAYTSINQSIMIIGGITSTIFSFLPAPLVSLFTLTLMITSVMVIIKIIRG